MKSYTYQLLDFLSPKGELRRRDFAILFTCAFLFLQILPNILFMLYHPYWKFNFMVNMSYEVGTVGLLGGILPLNVLLLALDTYEAIRWRNEAGYGFIIVAVVVDIMYLLYLFQCIRRCHDIGKKWYFCLIPFYNPWWLLLKKGKKLDEEIRE